MKSFAAILMLLPLAAWGGEADLGVERYREACANCHGETARGNGPNAPLIGVPVPDLTGFAARNGGVFDRAQVVRLIDGRAGLSAHGGPMPMFGGLLTGEAAVLDGPDGSPVTTTVPILAIVDYLATLQEE